MVSGEGGGVTEPKPIYNTLDNNELAKIHKASINNEPLSTKQLHELITSQAMTIDRLLGEVWRLNNEIELLQTNRRLLNSDVERYRAKNNHVCEWTGKQKHYHEITGDTLFRVRKTSCSNNHDDIVSVVDYTFCPNCGGQIKYIEEP